jgi:LuxR family maltose regulon positive regulatory protein
VPIPLITTKLYLPTPRPDYIHRPRLTEQLNTGLSRKLTLISAPAGFGKTTLVSSWINQAERPVAWLSLDESDNDLKRFLTYFIAALQTIENHIGQGALGALQSSETVNLETLLTSLINEMAESPEGVILVLDDYHVIEDHQIDQAVTFLLNHLPPQMHLVVSSRIDPSWPLARLRARGWMTEIRANDLRFTVDEATHFLNQSIEIEFAPEDITALGERTEGWIAGLQLAAISLQRIDSPNELSAFIHRFTGSDRYIQDYLADEVLSQCPEGTRDFLLQTAFLRRMCASLCDAVTGLNNGQSMLNELDAANLFIVPLDNERHWYRYHHLFADLLGHRLCQTYSELIPILHVRASEWFEKNNLPADSIHHAIAAKDFERVATLAERIWPIWNFGNQTHEWFEWVKYLPEVIIRSRPVLSVAYGQILLISGELEAAEARFLDAEQCLEQVLDLNNHPAKMLVIDQEQFRSLPGKIAMSRAFIAQVIGDIPGAIKYNQQALDLLPEEDHRSRGQISTLLGITYWTSGDLEKAHQTFSDGLAAIGNMLDTIDGIFVLADIKMTLGRLEDALDIYKHVIQLANESEKTTHSGIEYVYAGICEIYREQNNLEAARQAQTTSAKLGNEIEFPVWKIRWYIAEARLKEIQGDLDGAIDLLYEAERRDIRSPLPDVRPVSALRARIWVKAGKVKKALKWSRDRGLSSDDTLSYLREYEHITLARIIRASYEIDKDNKTIQDAIELLIRLLSAAEKGGRMGSVIEILILLALAHQAQGDPTTALIHLERALAYAKPEGYFRIFADEGPQMATLLKNAADRGIEPDYTQKILSAIESFIQKDCSKPNQSLVTSLSDRELEVLQLIAQGLTNREISERLFLAVDTVKGHNRNVFSKLGVHNRTEAVARAREIGLL